MSAKKPAFQGPVFCCTLSEMQSEYDPKQIEPKWQKYWEEKGIYEARNASDKPKWYSLMEFPYPSGDGLHTGHVRGFTAMDVVSRKRRMQGFNVMYPIGWDAFGLPTENYAIKTKRPPVEITKENTDTFKAQFNRLGMSFDWSREINTTDPAYYKWTQWLFLQFYKHDLAYKAKMTINWCPKDKIGLANEEVVDGKCERCGTPVEKREKEQWMLAITKYAERLDKDLDEVDFPERVKAQQRNWIGISEGAEIEFDTTLGEKIKVFTTRPDTIFGATYMVLAPEHAFIEKHADTISNISEVRAYVAQVKNTTEIDRIAENKEKSGIELKGVKAVNPSTKEEIPIWIADYVLPHYGTGAIMAVPADDERDHEFATKFNLPIVKGYTSAGSEDYGKKVTKSKLRDWVFSRQRYWGEPIPMVHCESCGWQPVPENELPVALPEVKQYEPTDTGESPLSKIEDWVNTTCPKCGGSAKRETDTMPNWAGSSWYFLRYTDPRNNEAFASQDMLKRWMSVDWYNGGMEHTTLHLLYARFWNKFLFDIGLVPTSEPFKKRTSHGLVLAEGGEKMSKSKGNVVNPDTIINQFGADTLRVYEMFMGPFEQAIAWSEESLVGPRRFIERVWKLAGKIDGNLAVVDEVLLNQTIKKVSDDIERLGFNTAISSLMVYTNALEKNTQVSNREFETLILLLAPFAPHVADELWQQTGHEGSIHEASWPRVDETKLEGSIVTMGVQINGKVRTTISVDRNMNDGAVKARVLGMPIVEKWLNGATPKKVIIVPGRIVNIVV